MLHPLHQPEHGHCKGRRRRHVCGGVAVAEDDARRRSRQTARARTHVYLHRVCFFLSFFLSLFYIFLARRSLTLPSLSLLFAFTHPYSLLHSYTLTILTHPSSSLSNTNANQIHTNTSSYSEFWTANIEIEADAFFFEGYRDEPSLLLYKPDPFEYVKVLNGPA